MKKVIMMVCLVVLAASQCWAETIYLKNGKKINGKVIEQDEQQLKIDVSGVKITYFMDEIDRVEGAATPTGKAPDVVPAPTRPAPPPSVEPVTQAAVPEVPQAAVPVKPPAITLPSPTPAIPTSSMPTKTQPVDLAKKAKILDLISVSGTRESMQSMFAQIISEAPPDEAAKLKGVFDLDEIISRFIPVYDKFFSDDDLTQLINFYKSPIGIKLIKVTPLLMEDSMTVSMDYFKEKMPPPPPEPPAAGTNQGTGQANPAPIAP